MFSSFLNRNKSCLLVGRPGSGAKGLEMDMVSERTFGDIIYRESLIVPGREGEEALVWHQLERYDTVVVVGNLWGADLSLMRDFLMNSRINFDKPLCYLVGDAQDSPAGTVRLFERNGPMWDAEITTLEKMRQKYRIPSKK